MTRTERRFLVHTMLLGLVLTSAVTMLEWGHQLEQLERWFHDVRARRCQYFTPPPTDKLVHLDIDDRALEAVGSWPWRRTVLAEIIDEIRIAGARAVAMDVIFSEPQEVDHEIAQGKEGVEVVTRTIDHDANFATAIRRSRNVLLPAALSFEDEAPPGESFRAMIDALRADLELTEEQASQRIAGEQLAPQDLANEFLAARREAMRQRVEESLRRRNYTLQELRQELLPLTEASGIVNSPLITLLKSQYDKIEATRALWRFMRPMPGNLPPLMQARVKLPPILQLSRATVSGGFVDYIPFSDGVVRSVPLWVDLENHLYPQMGLALACMMLGTDPGKLLLDRDQIVIPLPSGSKHIPVRTVANGSRDEVGMMFDVPWWGTDDWRTMYDHPQHRAPNNHLSITLAWDIVDMRRKISANNASIDRALEALLAYVDADAAQSYFAAVPRVDDFTARRPIVERALDELEKSGFLESYLAMSEAEMTDDDRRNRDALVKSKQALTEGLGRNVEMRQMLNRSRAALAEHLRGKAVLIGWIATGRADVVPTSLHARCPGVVVHGAIFNAIMTDNYWRFAPRWVTLFATILLGVLTTLAVGMLPPARAFLAAALIAGCYLAFNGLLLFDYANYVVGLAGPMVVVGVIWSGGTLFRLFRETIERNRIKRRFESYVDPKLVNYVLENPDRARLDGEVREMTVVFTDLAGFTTLSEKLQERTVELLNEFLSLMVPVIRDMHHGYVNKFLGDGIMFFYGAPLHNPKHAADAVATVLDMLKVLEEFNGKLAERGLPGLSLRAGISTGNMVVGDAGSKDASDYTVLGDCVNFGARLESANKALGTCALLSQRTVELVDSQFLVRPVGRIQVVGKTEGVLTYELLAYADQATDEQRELARMSADVVAAFQGRRFDDCLRLLNVLCERFGPSKFAKVYQDLSEQYRQNPPPEGFDGKITLTEK